MLYSEINNLYNSKNPFVKNKKFIYIGIAIIIAMIIIIICISRFPTKSGTYQDTMITATDNSFTLQIPGTISYQINNSAESTFVIDIYSKKDEMFIYANHIAKERMVDFYQIVKDDKERYISEKQNVREDSEIVQTKVNDYSAYEYSFTYSDSSYGKDFYSNVVWIETEKNLYVLNFEVINDNLEKYRDVFLNIKNSFTEL